MKKIKITLPIITILALSGCSSISNSDQNSNNGSNENNNLTSTETNEDKESNNNSAENSESSSSSLNLDPKEVDFRLSTLNEGSIIPFSYTSSGVELELQDMKLFANYITYDYAATSKIFLKGKYGFIRNLNQINGLEKISLKNSKKNAKVYVSNDFKSKNWTEIIGHNDEFNIGNYKYFIIMAKDSDVSFTEITFKYINADKTYTHPAYLMKNIKEIIDSKEVLQVTKISDEPLVNSQKWIDLGYAENYQAALADKENMDQAGYEGFADYQIQYNPNLLLNTKKQSYRIADMTYGDGGNSFQINMLDGSKGPVIYKDCVYTYVEDIAAYITAFGDVPINMQYDKNDKRSAVRDWGVNGRVNYNFYHNNAKGKFSFETEVPTHRYLLKPTQNEKDYYYKYYESDYGADVGNNEPYQMTTEYSKDKYNDGFIGQRGSLRFVWTHSYTSMAHKSTTTSYIENPYDRNIFFTNNHYNDFQQYLNYYGGWSLRFGNTTLGNGWGDYDETNHMDKAPNVILTRLDYINN